MQFLLKQSSESNRKLLSEHTGSINDLSTYEQELFTEFSSIHQTKSYILVAGCVLEHITSATDLSSPEKLYYLLADALCIINSNTGKKRAAALSSTKWADMLGCSRPQVFAMQKSLEKKGYLFVSKDKNKNDQDNRNLITTTLPDAIFKELCSLPNNTAYGNREKLFNPLTDSRRVYLDNTRLFVRINYPMLKSIISAEELSDFQKVMWLDFYSRAYKASISSGSSDRFSFIISYRDLKEQYSCTSKRISQSITELEKSGFIHRERFYIKGDKDIQARQDKSLWQITLTLPRGYTDQLMSVPNRANLKVKAGFAKKVREIAGINGNPNEDHITAPNLSRAGDSSIHRHDKETFTPQGQDKTLEDRIVQPLNASPETGLQVSENIIVEAQNNLNPALKAGQHKEKFSLSPDPACSSGLPPIFINKYFKINKNTKSNLEGKNPKVTFNDSYEKFKKQKSTKSKKDAEFNICAELIRQKLKILPQDKADKARKFAYSLVSRKLARGYTENLGKHELAKQLIFHAASWKPTEYRHLTREDCIDVALAAAWKAIVNGTWQAPLGWVKAQTLQYEFEYYKQKYQEIGVLSSYEITSLEGAVSSLLDSDYHGVLAYEITLGNKHGDIGNTMDNNTCNHCKKHSAALDKNHSSAIHQPLGVSESITTKHLSYNNTFLSEADGLEEEHCYSEDHIVSRTDFSILPDEQRLCVLTTLDEDNGIILETAAKKQYLVKAKALETNSYGEMIIVLQTDPAVILGNTDTCIDKTLSDVALNVTSMGNILAANDLAGTENQLIQKQELSGQEIPEYLPDRLYCDTCPVFQDSNNKVQTPTSYNCNSADFIDYAKLLDEK